MNRTLQIAILDTSDAGAIVAYERAFYLAFRRATTNRLVRKLWNWNEAEGRVSTRIPYADQRIYTLLDQSGGIRAALAANFAMRQFQGKAFGFSPEGCGPAVEVLTFFSVAHDDINATLRMFREFLRDARDLGSHAALATTAERPLRVYRRLGWRVVAKAEIESERRYFLRFDLRVGTDASLSTSDPVGRLRTSAACAR